MAYFRKAAGLSQQELADKLGWLKSVVSTAERTWEARRTRNFTVDDLVEIASALGLPVAAFLLPPENDGVAIRYVLEQHSGDLQPMHDLLPLLTGVVTDHDSPAVTAYRNRLMAAGAVDSLAERAAQVLAIAQQMADQAIEEARGESDATLNRARGEAERILDFARRVAEEITGDARVRAESLEQDAQERHRQAVGNLVVQREQLERRVDDLRVFEREYRSRLLAFIESAYSDLWAGTEGADANALLRELRARAEQRGRGRFSVLLLDEGGTYDSFTSEDLTEEPERGSDGADEAASALGLSREAMEQAEALARDLRHWGIPGPYVITQEDNGKVTVTSAAPREDAGEGGDGK